MTFPGSAFAAYSIVVAAAKAGEAIADTARPGIMAENRSREAREEIYLDCFFGTPISPSVFSNMDTMACVPGI